MKIAVVGGAGFIGTNVENYFICWRGPIRPKVIERNEPLDFSGCDAVIHLAANADVRGGWADPQKDMRGNLMLTSDILEAMRKQGVKKLVFTSTGSVYKPATHAHKETDHLQATSLYAASKIACEQLIAAYAEAGHLKATVLRLVSVLGPHYSHGLLVDFARKLASDPEHMEVIFPGSSQKSYVHVSDVVSAIHFGLQFEESYGVYNVGTDETTTPAQIARWVTDKPILLTGNTWVGDNPTILLDTSKLKAKGWSAKWSIKDAVLDTVKWLREQEKERAAS